MSDQCQNCTLRGDYETCIKTECFHHENWINKVRINKIKSLERQLEEMESLVKETRGYMTEASYEYIRERIKELEEQGDE